jgi:hypothetical protein
MMHVLRLKTQKLHYSAVFGSRILIVRLLHFGANGGADDLKVRPYDGKETEAAHLKVAPTEAPAKKSGKK